MLTEQRKKASPFAHLVDHLELQSDRAKRLAFMVDQARGSDPSDWPAWWTVDEATEVAGILGRMAELKEYRRVGQFRTTCSPLDVEPKRVDLENSSLSFGELLLGHMEPSATRPAGWTRKTLAEALGYAEPTVAVWCRNESMPSVEKFHSLLELLGLSEASAAQFVVVQAFKTAYNRQKPERALELLSPDQYAGRAEAVEYLLSRGFSNLSVAQRLDVSVNRVRQIRLHRGKQLRSESAKLAVLSGALAEWARDPGTISPRGTRSVHSENVEFLDRGDNAVLGAVARDRPIP